MLMQIEIDTLIHIFLSFSWLPRAVKRLGPRILKNALFIVILEVICNHVQEHKRAHSTAVRLIKASSLPQKSLKHKVKRP